MDSSQEFLHKLIQELVIKTQKDVLEIGLGYGENTLHFLKIAQFHGRKVLGIDPFEQDWGNMPKSYGEPYPYEKFCEHIKGYENDFVLCKRNSLSSHAEDFVKEHKHNIGVAFIDGLQYKNAVISDFNICKGIPHIIFDDYQRHTSISEVPVAVEQIINTTDYSISKTSENGRYVLLSK